LCSSQSGDDPPKDLAKFGYKLNKKVEFKNICFYNFWLPTGTMYRNRAMVCSIFFGIMAIKNRQKHITFNKFKFLLVFLAIYIYI
jgi:hypothetical protein